MLLVVLGEKSTADLVPLLSNHNRADGQYAVVDINFRTLSLFTSLSPSPCSLHCSLSSSLRSNGFIPFSLRNGCITVRTFSSVILTNPATLGQRSSTALQEQLPERKDSPHPHHLPTLFFTNFGCCATSVLVVMM